ncbi:MAG: restriction endonuclease subunit S [Rikenellaceae bacterium]
MKQNKEIPAGYKDSSLGIIPEDWEVKKLSQISEIDSISLGSNTPCDYEFEYISLSDVDSDEFQIETTKQVFKSAPSRARRVVSKGDILMSTVRPNLQEFSIIKSEVKNLIASTGFAVISATKCNNEYLFHMLFSSSISKQIYQVLVGSNYPAINSSDVKNLKFAIPPLKEQDKIAKILGTWDEAIEKQKILVEKLEKRKRGLMRPILKGKIRRPKFIEKREDTELGDLLDYMQPTPYLVRDTLYDNTYPVPVLTAGKTFVLGYTNEIDGVFVDLPVIIFDDFTTASKFVNFPFKAKSSAMKLLKTKRDVNIKFVYEAMQQIKYAIGGHERHWISKFSFITIPLPSIEEQNSIAEVIICFDREIDLARDFLATFRSQKQGLMQQLLTGKTRVKL